MYFAADIVDALDTLTQDHSPFRSADLSVRVRHGLYCARVRLVRRAKCEETGVRTISFSALHNDAISAVEAAFDSARSYLRRELHGG